MSPVTVNTNVSGFNRNPHLCVVGSTVFALFAAPDGANAFFTSHLAVSTDSGASFGTEEQLLADGLSGGVFDHAIDCYLAGSNPTAFVLMDDERSGSSRVTIEGYESGGSGQLGDFTAGPGLGDEFLGGVTCQGCGSDCCYTFASSENDARGDTDTIYAGEADVFTQTSQTQKISSDTAGGSGASLPEARSRSPRIVADGQSNIWVSWLDDSAGDRELVARHSGNDGMSYGDLHRMSVGAPQGTRQSDYIDFYKHEATAASNGEAFFVFAARRESPFFSGILGVYDAGDFDRDQFSPTEVASVSVVLDAGMTRISWTSQDGATGSGTAYDITTGRLSDLRSSGGYGGASCEVDDHPDTPYEAVLTDPPTGDGDWFLVRAQNSCADGTYGDSSLATDPRDALDSSGPCP
jgi:hypothetical protein